MKNLMSFIICLFVCFLRLHSLPIQSDTSDALWSIVKPLAIGHEIDMKKVLIGKSKDSIVINFITNAGNCKFRVDSIYIIGKDASAFKLVSGFPKYFIKPANNHWGEFNFKPNRVGIHKAQIIVVTQSETLSINIIGEGIKPQLQVVSEVIDFGKVNLGYSKDTLQVFTIKNIGLTTLNITNTRHNKPNDIDFTTISGGGSFSLAPGEIKKMDLKFQPSEIGRTCGLLEFYYNGFASPLVIMLLGEGIKIDPRIQYQNSNMNNLICENKIADTIKISNTGGVPLIINELSITGKNSKEFSIQNVTPISIEPNTNIDLIVLFQPISTGIKTAQLNIKSNSDTNSFLSIPLISKKDSVIIVPEYKTINFGNLLINENKDTLLKILNLGSISSNYYLKCTNGISINKTFGYIKTNNSDSIVIHFNGFLKNGFIDDTITVSDEICNFSYYVRIIGSVGKINPEIKFSKLFFSDLKCDSEIKDTLKLINTGYSDLVISEINLRGTDKSDFSINIKLPIIIMPDSIKHIIISFIPNSSGNKNAEIEIISNSFPDSVITIPITAKKELISFEPSVAEINLGYLCQNEIKDTTLSIVNIGTIENSFHITLSSNLFASDFDFRLNKNDKINIPIKFKGIVNFGNFSETITIIDSICGLSKLVKITGEITKQELNIDSINLGDLCSNSITYNSINIKNIGKLKFIGNIKTSEDIILSTNNFNLEAGDEIHIPFKFLSPSIPGTFRTKIIIQDSVCGFLKEIQINGNIINPFLDVEDMVIVAINGTYKDEKLILKNKSSNDIMIKNVQGINNAFKIIENQFPIFLPSNGNYELTIRYYAQDYINDTNNLVFEIEPCAFSKNIKLIGISSSAFVNLLSGSTKGFPGDTVYVPIKITNQQNLNLSGATSLSVDLTYNSTLLLPLDFPITKVDKTTNKITLNNLPLNKNIGDPLANVRFIAGLGNSDSCGLVLTNAKSIDGNVDIVLKNGDFKLLGVCPEGGNRLINTKGEIKISSIKPNPADENIEIELNLIEKTGYKISIINSNGQYVKEIKSKYSNKGITNLNINISDLSSGVYNLILQTESERISKQFLIIR